MKKKLREIYKNNKLIVWAAAVSVVLALAVLVFVKDEVFRYLNYYHSQYFRGYSQEDLQNLINKIKSKVGDQASQEEIETRAKSYLDASTKPFRIQGRKWLRITT